MRVDMRATCARMSIFPLSKSQRHAGAGDMRVTCVEPAVAARVVGGSGPPTPHATNDVTARDIDKTRALARHG